MLLMTLRDAVFWGIFIFLLLIPGGVIGWIRSRAILRAYSAIHSDLHRAGIALSPPDLTLLFKRLSRNSSEVLSEETSPVAKSIKQPHIDALLVRTKALKRYFWIALAIGGGAMVSFLNLWPAPHH
jgi:hypothetical protein